jgi:PIN domain nuclease of toxin-antitoxin system
MRLLLDTHTLLWFLTNDRHLSPAARTAIEDMQNTSWVSAATLWEVAIKVALGKLTLPAA